MPDHTSPHRVWATWTTPGPDGTTVLASHLIHADTGHAEATIHTDRINRDPLGWLTERGHSTDGIADLRIETEHVPGCHGCEHGRTHAA